MQTKFESAFSQSVPELKFNQDGTSNWNEVEKWLRFNSPEFSRACSLAHCYQLDEIDLLKIAVQSLAISKQELFNLAIKNAEMNPPPIFIPKTNLKPIPLYKKIWNLIRTGEWI